MVIEISGVQFGLKSSHDFKIGQARIATLIWNHKYEFRPKFGNTNFNYHFIRAILKSQNPVSTNIMLIQ